MVTQGQTDGNRGHRLLAALTPLALAGLLVGLLLAALWTAALAAVPGTASPIYTRSNEDGLPDIAASAGGAYLALAWSRGYNSISGPTGYVYLDVASEAEGEWRIPIRMYPATAPESTRATEARTVFDPRTAYSTTLHVVWSQPDQVFYTTCNVAASLCAATAITQVSASNGPNQPDVAVDTNGCVHVVWVTTNGTVQYRCSPNGGISWNSTIPVENAPSITVTQPSIAYAGNRVHVVWAEGPADFDTIGYRNANVASGGGCVGSFNSAVLFEAGGLWKARDPKLAALANTVYVVWDVNPNQMSSNPNVITYYLVYNRSLDGGTSWESPDGSSHEYLDITTASSITFTGRPVPGDRLPYNYDYGNRLHPDVTLEFTGSHTIAHAVWQEGTIDWTGNETNYFDVFYTSRDANGTEPWAAPTNVTAGTQTEPAIYSVMPSVAIGQNGRVHIAYMQEKDSGPNTPEDWDIYYFGSLTGPAQGGVYLPIILKNSS